MTRGIGEPETVYRLAVAASLATLAVVLLDAAFAAGLVDATVADVDGYLPVFDLFLITLVVDAVAIGTYVGREPFRKRDRLRARLALGYCAFVALATLLSLAPVHRALPLDLRHFVVLFVGAIATGAVVVCFRDPQTTLPDFGPDAFDGAGSSVAVWRARRSGARRHRNARLRWERDGRGMVALAGVVVALGLYHPAGPQLRDAATVLLGASLLLPVLPELGVTHE